MNEIKTITATGIPLLLDDFDTDRICLAQYLRANPNSEHLGNDP